MATPDEKKNTATKVEEKTSSSNNRDRSATIATIDEDIYETTQGLNLLSGFLKKTLTFRDCVFVDQMRMPNRQVKTIEKRVELFKGEKLIALLNDEEKIAKLPKKLPKMKDEQDMLRIINNLIREKYLLRADKKEKGVYTRCRTQRFDADGYYIWIYEGEKFWNNFYTGLLIAGFLFFTCFPIWPLFLKIWLWYLSVTLLIFMTGLIAIRLVFFLLFWMFGFDFWFLPNLFDEDLSFTDSFKPVCSFEKSEGQLVYRLVLICMVGTFVHWCYNQPTDFDDFLQFQGQMVSDLYEGKFLSDRSQEEKDNIDAIKVPTVEDLLNELDEEENEVGDTLIDHLLDLEDDEDDKDDDDIVKGTISDEELEINTDREETTREEL